MPRTPNRHTILSHGGKHGDGKTYLCGSSIAPSDSGHVPDNLTHDLAVPGKHGIKDRPVVKVEAKTVKVEAKTVKVQADTVNVAKTPKASPEPTPPPPPPVEEEKVEGLKEAVTIPTSRRQLNRLSKEDCFALALELGGDVPEDINRITVRALRKILLPLLGL